MISLSNDFWRLGPNCANVVYYQLLLPITGHSHRSSIAPAPGTYLHSVYFIEPFQFVFFIIEEFYLVRYNCGCIPSVLCGIKICQKLEQLVSICRHFLSQIADRFQNVFVCIIKAKIDPYLNLYFLEKVKCWRRGRR